MLTNLACSISHLRGEWDYATVQRLHHRHTRSQSTEGWKGASENNNWMIVQCATFPEVRILEISIKAFRISRSVSGSHLKAVFGYPYPVANSLSSRISNRQTGWWSSVAQMCIGMDPGINPQDLLRRNGHCLVSVCFSRSLQTYGWAWYGSLKHPITQCCQVILQKQASKSEKQAQN